MFPRRLFAFVPALALLTIDRVFKIFFLTNPTKHFGGDFFYGLITFHFESNSGIAFGIMMPRIFLLLLSAVIIILVVSFSIRSRSALVSGASMAIAVGALSNFFDRIKYGMVIDYVDVRWFTVLNVADIMISVGAILLVLMLWQDDKKKIRLDTRGKIS